MSTQPVIIAVSGSIRSSHQHTSELLSLINQANDIDELTESIRKSEKTFSNSDIASAIALLGARLNGAKVDLVSLLDLFKHRNENLYGGLSQIETMDDLEEIDTLSLDEANVKDVLKRIEESNGIIISSPVYFGDRSSVANKILQLTDKTKVLHDKAVGVVSIGAKRNGGQETTIIYSLFESLMQGAVAVGNGPKTAQYGGTVVAGDPMTALDDKFGADTSFGTGRQVAQAAKVIMNGTNVEKGEESEEAPKTLFVITMDTSDQKYEKIVRDYAVRNQVENYEVLNLTDKNIYRCIACPVCPSPAVKKRHEGEEDIYSCIIQSPKDYMRELRVKLLGADNIVLVGVNTSDNLIYRYQAFMERTRFIRREDFELTNRCIISLSINEVGCNVNPIFNVKAITSFIRHNTFIIKPMQIVLKDDQMIYEDSAENFIGLTQRIKIGRKHTPPLVVSYKATGYENKTLDETSALRS